MGRPRAARRAGRREAEEAQVERYGGDALSIDFSPDRSLRSPCLARDRGFAETAPTPATGLGLPGYEGKPSA
jgi:hypothetical protein